MRCKTSIRAKQDKTHHYYGWIPEVINLMTKKLAISNRKHRQLMPYQA